MALPGLYLDEPGCPGMLPGLEGLEIFRQKNFIFTRYIPVHDPGGSGINRSTAGLSGTDPLHLYACMCMGYVPEINLFVFVVQLEETKLSSSNLPTI